VAAQLGHQVQAASCFEREHLLVKWKHGPDSIAAAESNARLGAVVQRNFNALGWQLVTPPPHLRGAAGVQAYQALGEVLAVEADHWIPATPCVIPNDSLYSQQWHLSKIGAPIAWETTTGSTNVVVAVFDSGVDYTHPDLAPNIWRNQGETGLDQNGNDKATNGIDDDDNGYVDDLHGVNVWDGTGDPMDTGWMFFPPTVIYHGTAVASAIGAVGNNALGIAGINWSVKILPIKVLAGDDSNPEIFRSFSLGGMLAAWNYVLEMKRRGVNIRVTSHSEGLTAHSVAVREAIIAAGNEGILTVIAAGNDGIDHDIFSGYANVQNLAPILYVAGTDQSDRPASFTDYGRSTVHLAAPAVSILSTAPGARYENYSGTSFSCPLVAGAAALLLAAQPDLTVDQLKAALLGSVDQIPGFKGKLITGGRMNVARALKYLTNAINPPIVITALPAGQRTPVDFPIRVTFSRPMDSTSVESAFTITPSIDGSFVWAADNRSFSYRPAAFFDRTTNYTVCIRGLAQDEGGQMLDGNFNQLLEGSPADDFVWTFRFPVLNDNFAEAHDLSGGSGVTNGNNRYTILEDREPDYGFSAYGLASVWYRWAAPTVGGWFTFALTGSSTVDQYIAVYTGGELAELTAVATNDNDGVRLSSRVSFPTTAGTTYAIAVVGKSAIPNLNPFTVSNPFTLTWYPTPPPAFNGTQFTPASGEAGTKVTLTGTNFTGATSVLFNGSSASFTNALTNNLDLRITAVVPPDAISGPITVVTPHGNVTSTALFQVPPPKLNITLSSSTGLQFRWPSASSAWVLEETEELHAGSWTPVVQTPVMTNGETKATLGTPAGNRFYRLKRN